MQSFFGQFLLKRKLKLLKIKLGLKTGRLPRSSTLFLEEGCRISEMVCRFQSLKVGAYSYLRSGGELRNVRYIGRFCSIGNGVILGQERYGHPLDWVSTHPFQRDQGGQEFIVSRQYTHLEHDVWVGRDAVVMDGVTVGVGAVIGARAMVTRDVPPYAIVAGVPAKIIRYRHPPGIIAGLLASQWWEFPREYLLKAPMDRPKDFLLYVKDCPPRESANYEGCAISRSGFDWLDANELKL